MRWPPWKLLVRLAWELGVYLQHCAGSQALSAFALRIAQKLEIMGVWESYIGHSASQAKACRQLASALVIFVSLDNAFYNSVLSYQFVTKISKACCCVRCS